MASYLDLHSLGMRKGKQGNTYAGIQSPIICWCLVQKQNGIVIFIAEKIVGKAVGKVCVEPDLSWDQSWKKAWERLFEEGNLNTSSILVVKTNSTLYPNLDAFIAPWLTKTNGISPSL